jgi:hypothetical protein
MPASNSLTKRPSSSRPAMKEASLMAARWRGGRGNALLGDVAEEAELAGAAAGHLFSPALGNFPPPAAPPPPGASCHRWRTPSSRAALPQTWRGVLHTMQNEDTYPWTLVGHPEGAKEPECPCSVKTILRSEFTETHRSEQRTHVLLL